MSIIEGDKKPYQPTKEEIALAEIMTPDNVDHEYGSSDRERILTNQTNHIEDRAGLDVGISDVIVIDGKVMGTKDTKKDTEERGLGKNFKFVEISPEEALEELNFDEDRLRRMVDKLETAIHRTQKTRQEILALKGEKERK